MDARPQALDARSGVPPPEVVARLADNHRRFLAFLERRVGSRAAAEDILQDAFVRGMGAASALRAEESAVAWFYRLLRNAIADHFRRRGAEERALERYAAEAAGEPVAADAELSEAVCQCVQSLVGTLKPEYAQALRRIDLDGLSLGAFAAEAGITANNAGVRAHRARLALRRQVERSCGTCAVHGCYRCECGAAEGGQRPRC